MGRSGGFRAAPLAAALLFGLSGPAWAAPGEAPLKVFAAGSLVAAMTELIAQSGIEADQVAPPVFGSAGALGDRIAAGADADMLASADMAQPRRLSKGQHPVVLFARNQICAFHRRGLELTPSNFLDRLLQPKVRIATSRPVVDPSGDYAQQVFALADRLRPGAGAVLNAKAIRLGGGAAKPAPGGNAAADLLLTDKADVLLSYCSGLETLSHDVPDVVATPAPPELAPPVEFGLVVLSANPLADRLAVFIVSERGQAILSRHGFIPVAKPRGGP